MPSRKKARKNASPTAAAAAGGRDDISDLPDGVLQHMLSFLPAQDAVRTCVLAKRWRHLWKFTTVLRFVCGGIKEPESMNEVQDFMDQLLCLRMRGSTPLDMCEFRLGYDDGSDTNDIIQWIRLALYCKVQVLQLMFPWDYYAGITTPGGHPFFITQYLKKLELEGLDLEPSRLFLDFSCCPNLEDLEIVECRLEGALLISSRSLKRLTLQDCRFDRDCRMPICVLNLVSLWLQIRNGRTTSFQRMPSLLTAFVKILGLDHVPLHSDNDNHQSILLQSLSEVRNLVLLSPYTEMFVFRRDLKFCSSFNKLKSLLLDEYWCEPAHFSALACLLKLSPVLEKLTLQLYSKGPKHKVEIKLSCKPLEVSAEISQHLKTLEVKCPVFDEKINNVLTFTSKQLNIWFQFGG